MLFWSNTHLIIFNNIGTLIVEKHRDYIADKAFNAYARLDMARSALI